MSNFYVVVDNIKDWQPYYPSPDVISFDDYMERIHGNNKKRTRVVNLCHDYRYLKAGYYCSLLAEARGHHVFPSVATINDLSRKTLVSIHLDEVNKQMNRIPVGNNGDILTFRSLFGQSLDKQFSRLAQMIFEKFPCPLLEITMVFKHQWHVKRVKAISIRSLLIDSEQEIFANAFEKFSLKMWRKSKTRKPCRYDLAILVNADESFPPSDAKALTMFKKAAYDLGIATELITRKDYLRLPEYDGLFIRETTAVDDHTYQFAKLAESEGMVVIDDPSSILRCTNKIYLADLFKTHKISTPNTIILNQPAKSAFIKLQKEIGFPMVLKIPDGSFSRGVVKVETMAELEIQAKHLLKESAMLLAQEFMYTQYDWRVGILNNNPLYACRYYMVDEHWQIYKHESQNSQSGIFETLATFEVPKAVIDIAVKATKLIGNGFYGVDIKQSGDRVVVIEVNDNPSIDSDIEDKYLGAQLYTEIMKEFLRRMESRGR